MPFMSSLLQLGLFDTEFEHCKWTKGGQNRAKWTRLRSNIQSFKSLAGRCHQDHQHLGRGQKPDRSFSAADEAEYPLQMCEAIAECVVTELAFKGFEGSKATQYHNINIEESLKEMNSNE
jgi:hypothetical protein